MVKKKKTYIFAFKLSATAGLHATKMVKMKVYTRTYSFTRKFNKTEH